MEFEGRNYAGRATGMLLEANDERARLMKDVDVTIRPESNDAKPNDGKGSPGASGGQRSASPEERAARKARKRARKEGRRRKAEQLAKADAPSSYVLLHEGCGTT